MNSLHARGGSRYLSVIRVPGIETDDSITMRFFSGLS
jgi:hypothetical protein